MFDTISVFDNMELDRSNERVASRRALALADTRVEQHLGAFLRGAQSEEEFEQRLALVAEDMTHYVNSAAEEIGFEHPEYIAATLKEHYKLAVKFEKTPTEEVEEEDEEKTASRTALVGVNPLDPMGQNQNPGTMPPPVNPAANAAGTPQAGGPPNLPPNGQVPGAPAPSAGQPTPPTGAQTPLAPAVIQQNPNLLNAFGSTWHEVTAEEKHWIDKAIKHPGALHEELGVPKDEKIPEDKLKAAEHSDNPKERERANLAETLKGFHHGAEVQVQHPDNLDPYTYQELEDPGLTKRIQERFEDYSPVVHHPTDPNTIIHNPGNFWDGPRHLQYDPQGGTAVYKNPYTGDTENLSGRDERVDYSDRYDDQGQYIDEGPRHTGVDYYGQPVQQSPRPGDGEDPNEGYVAHVGSAQDTTEQDDDSGRLVPCPVCGGQDSKNCSKCHGAGKVKNFGGSVLDALDEKNAAGNTDLGGPEPKIDKGKWTETDPPKPKDESDGRWPNKMKDPTEPIPARNRSEEGHDLTEIGEKSTEHVDLPSESGDKPFADGLKGFPGAHTDTFGNDGQVDPVTHETQSSVFPSANVVDRAFAAL